MTRTLVAAAAAWLVLCGSSAAAEGPKFSTPPSADQQVEAKDKAVTVRYDQDAWEVKPRVSKYRLFAIVQHNDADVSGMLLYRGDSASEKEVRERVTAELEMMDDHEAEFSKRTVNGVPVLHMKARAKKKNGDDIVVRSYYWFSPNGVVDYAVMGPPEDFEADGDAWMDLLNGLEIAEARAAR
jgi:hypothetical protein